MCRKKFGWPCSGPTFAITKGGKNYLTKYESKLSDIYTIVYFYNIIYKKYGKNHCEIPNLLLNCLFKCELELEYMALTCSKSVFTMTTPSVIDNEKIITEGDPGQGLDAKTILRELSYVPNIWQIRRWHNHYRYDWYNRWNPDMFEITQ